ncbi:MAG TPA: hypothetical protein GYA10_09755 [Alphaproteobacteria bacterium]|nr:hypothetical protein [Alphaproteobacteria bacterium]
MSFDLDDLINSRPLPTDVTPRQPIYRRQGIVAALLTALAVHAANRRLRQIARRFRRGTAPEIPNYLREDLGLPPLPPRLPSWWEIRP